MEEEEQVCRVGGAQKKVVDVVAPASCSPDLRGGAEVSQTDLDCYWN